MEPGNRSARDWSRETAICLVIFLAALFIVIAVSIPGLVINDEWMTVNQVHQLSAGHQVSLNEGKYGSYYGGIPSRYFTRMNNVLRYSLALPLASMPAMLAISLFGDHFRLAVLFLWASIPLVTTLLVSRAFPEYARVLSVRLPVIGAVATFLLLVLNGIWYSPFIASTANAPVEVAAVVFTSHLFFALTIVMAYLIAARIFHNRWMAVAAAVFCMAGSTYLLWGGTAKDHSATAAVFSLVLFFFVSYFQSRRFRDAACGFFFIGLLAWFRPEIGLAAAICLGILFAAENLLRIWQKKDTMASGLAHMGAVLFTALGALPFFINNLIVSGNPLLPALVMERNVRYGITNVVVSPVSPVAETGSQVVTADPVTLGSGFFVTLQQYVFTLPRGLPGDLAGILFFPENGSLGFFLIVPVLLLALVLLPFFLLQKREKNNLFREDMKILILLSAAVFLVFLAYTHNLHNINTGDGIWPDIRYLSPAYLPATLLGLLLLEKMDLIHDPGILVRNTVIPGFLLAVFLAVPAIATVPAGNISLHTLYRFFGILVLAEILAIAALVLVSGKRGRPGSFLAEYALPVPVLTVLAWQLVLILLVFPIAKFDGYSFWIPCMDALHQAWGHLSACP
ncbi:hypothetical protein [Methanoregula sp.]|uniref:hypothetical protein n=1 Tax=Methanoregula sp. TaxID=2052170 RepID=UPI000CBC211C|nr:hypothetical protein [Methanoregula sp.]PKG32202.1 MAG: hypothetical protein CW742_09390 [Methanoregula sp.]